MAVMWKWVGGRVKGGRAVWRLAVQLSRQEMVVTPGRGVATSLEKSGRISVAFSSGDRLARTWWFIHLRKRS